MSYPLGYRNFARLLVWYGSSVRNMSTKPGPLAGFSVSAMRAFNRGRPWYAGGLVPERGQGSLAPYSQSSTEPSPTILREDDNVISGINEQIQSNNHGRLFAVVHVTGRQYKITAEDVIVIRGHWAPDIGDRLRLEKVMLVGGSDFSLLGKPLLPRDLVRIEATVLEKTLSNTKLQFRHIPRGNYKRLKFFRLPYTMVRINLIEFDGLVDERKEIEGLRPATLW